MLTTFAVTAGAPGDTSSQTRLVDRAKPTPVVIANSVTSVRRRVPRVPGHTQWREAGYVSTAATDTAMAFAVTAGSPAS